jgi:tripartite-type tricarboxylate transporter receptor subunit TctC
MDDRSMIGNAVLLSSKLSYDSLRDLAPIANVIRIPNGVFVRTDFPATTMREFVDYARKNPGKVNYGSFGIASPPHIIIEGMSKQFGIQLTHIPYKGIAEVIPALLGGQIQFGLGGVSVLVPLAKEGRIRVLASGSKRSTLMPDVPTYAEVGVTLKSLSWTGLFVPAATPRSIIAKIAQDLKTVFSSPDFASKFVEGVGLETDYLGTEEFAQMLREDLKVYGSEIKDMNIKLD